MIIAAGRVTDGVRRRTNEGWLINGGHADDAATLIERARAIGLFRYMLIREAADATLTGRQRGALVRALAAQAHTEPDGRIVRITRWTLDRWIQNYREGGFDALVPSPRQSQPRTAGGVRAGCGVEKGEPVPFGGAGPPDPARPARLGAQRDDPAADVRADRVDRAARTRRAGRVRPVRGRPAE